MQKEKTPRLLERFFFLHYFQSGDAVSDLYPIPSKFSGGTIDFVAVTVEGTPYIDLEAEAKRVLMSQ